MKKIIISNTELENHEYLFENYILGKKTLYIAITDDPNFYDTFRNLTKYYTSSDSYVNKNPALFFHLLHLIKDEPFS